MLKIYKLFIFISLITISKLTYSQINVDILTQVDSSFISKDTISICAENVIGLYANVSGGTSPYTYDWYGADSLLMGTSSPFTTFIASNPGTYMIGCLVTDDYGNVCKDSVIIIVKALPDLILSPLNDSICIGDSITLTASGASTILWFDDNDNLIGWGSQIIISPTSNTNYFVVGVQSGCSKTQSINIKVFQPPIVNAGNDTIICSLDSISLHASASNYLNIQWTSNGTGNYTNTNDLNTIYIPSTQDWANGSVILTLTASGYADCPDAHDQLTINFIDVPDLISSTDTTICEGESVTISANGANSFLWSEGSNTSSIIVSPSLNTTYYVTGSIDICQRIDSFIVYVNPAPIFNLGNDTTICYNDSVTIHAPLGFAGYQWNTGDTTNFISVIPTDTTTYTVTVTNEYGCTASDDITINVRPDLGIDAGADQSICEGQSTVLSASGGISYIWSTGETTANITVTPTDTTVYYVTGTDGICNDIDSVIVNVYPNLINLITTPDTQVCMGDAITLEVYGAQTYLWSTGQTDSTIQVIINSDTTYYVTGYAYGCEREDSVVIMHLPLPIFNLGNDTTICYNDSVTIHAPIGFAGYQWNTGDTTNFISVIPTDTTTYTVTVTNEYGCTASDDITINVRPDLGIDAGADQSICEGQSTVLSASGGISYIWSTGETTANITVTPTDTTVYYVTGTDGICNDIDSVIVNVYPNLINLITTPDTQVCMGDAITLEVYGAQTYLWSTGQTDSTIQVIINSDTTYYVTGYAYGCEREDSVVIMHLPLPIFNLGNDTTICYNDSVTIHAPIGFAGYQWNTGDTTNFISVIPTDTTTYTVTVTNEYGCTASDDITINVRPDLGIDAGADQSICEGQSTVLSASGGISYIWSTGETTANITVTPTDTTVYYVTGTDGICNDIDSVIVNVYPNLINLITTPDTQVCMGDAITLEVYGAQTYLWSTGQTDSTIQVIINSDTTYYVTGYAYGCEREDSVVITVGTPITLNISPADTTVCPGSNVILTVEGATNYLWNTGDTGSSIVVIPYDTTIYSVTGYDSGCTAQISAIVNTYSVDMVTIDSIPPICTGDSAQLIANGTGIIYWSTGDTTNSIWVSPTNDTIYIVNMLDTNGCVTSDTINVVVSLPPNVILNYTSPACMNSYINISAQNATYYSWSTGDSTAEIIIYLEQDTTIYVTATNIYGCSSIDSITIIPDSSAIITHMNDTIVCMHTILGLWANGANTIIWSTGDTGNVINSIITQDTTFYIHSISGTCESYDSIHVQIYPPLYVDAGHDTTVMAGTNAYLHGNVIGGGVSSISWSPSDSMQGSNTLNPIVVVDSSMYFILTVTDTNGCTWMDMVYVNVIPYGIYLESLSDTIICSGDSLILSVNHLFGGTPPYSYEWIIDTNSDTLFGNPITILPTGNSYIYLSVSDSEGYFTYDTMYVSVITTPEPDLPDTLHICYGDTVALDPQTLGSCLWSTGDTSSILEILITQDTLIYLTITNNICSAYDTSLIFMKPLPYIYIYPASDSLCPGDTAVFVVISDGTIQWDNGSINDTLMFEAITNDTIYVTSELNSCYSTAFATTYIYEVPDIILNTNAWNDEVLPGQPLILEILPNTFSYYIVNNSENTFTDTINHFSLYISPGGDLIYVIAVTSEGCESYETIFINSRTIPNGFTPNADNVNDVFMPGVPIKILNRWGQVVYEGDNGWDGTIDNKQAMPGTYFYIIELQDENGKLIKTYKGDLLLIKN